MTIKKVEARFYAVDEDTSVTFPSYDISYKYKLEIRKDQ
jgi:hypothetical protein